MHASIAAPHGGAWHGSGRLTVEGMPLGTLDWNTSPWPLIRGHLDANLRLRGDRIEARAGMQASRGGVHVTGLEGRADLTLLARLAHLPTALTGTLVANIRMAALGSDGSLESLDGQFEAHGARLPELGVALGTLALRLSPGGNGIHGVLSNSGGDLDLGGELQLTQDGRYVLRATLRPHAGQNRMRDALSAVLGAPDAQGRYHYNQTGRLQPPA